eukprot:TRINITY_DN4780_c0_g1_i12.p1 TRINITY_DN4780_c0_g1~~TRINITY_DN4780_c0_g1_i12.p1  ORF type:complete len:623 (-),score=72.88 TRINITY_DN4780_c0_g1_i12:29-1897(-)
MYLPMLQEKILAMAKDIGHGSTNISAGDGESAQSNESNGSSASSSSEALHGSANFAGKDMGHGGTNISAGGGESTQTKESRTVSGGSNGSVSRTVSKTSATGNSSQTHEWVNGASHRRETTIIRNDTSHTSKSETITITKTISISTTSSNSTLLHTIHDELKQFDESLIRDELRKIRQDIEQIKTTVAEKRKHLETKHVHKKTSHTSSTSHSVHSKVSVASHGGSTGDSRPATNSTGGVAINFVINNMVPASGAGLTSVNNPTSTSTFASSSTSSTTTAQPSLIPPMVHPSPCGRAGTSTEMLMSPHRPCGLSDVLLPRRDSINQNLPTMDDGSYSDDSSSADSSYVLNVLGNQNVLDMNHADVENPLDLINQEFPLSTYDNVDADQAALDAIHPEVSAIAPGAMNGCACVGLQAFVGPSVDMPLFAGVASGFGSSCEAWDAGQLVCQRLPMPQWCSARWCYVDPSACNVLSWSSVMYNHVAASGQTLHYSYEACGSLDTWTSTHHPEVRARLAAVRSAGLTARLRRRRQGLQLHPDTPRLAEAKRAVESMLGKLAVQEVKDLASGADAAAGAGHYDDSSLNSAVGGYSDSDAGGVAAQPRGSGSSIQWLLNALSRRRCSRC